MITNDTGLKRQTSCPVWSTCLQAKTKKSPGLSKDGTVWLVWKYEGDNTLFRMMEQKVCVWVCEDILILPSVVVCMPLSGLQRAVTACPHGVATQEPVSVLVCVCVCVTRLVGLPIQPGGSPVRSSAQAAQGPSASGSHKPHSV